ncbi:ATP-binding cassette domain-containing protein [Methylotuvimicrobium sp. KM2]|uniref:ABC transporter ATP-binding protein n=1 Tax=Methylotuvimicrobium sp. KM2 TaxID=3133976 RepID=UPI003100F781
MLEVSQLTRCYGDFVAVDKVGFSIGQGEIVGLLGHNGAGKTTIMKMLSGYLEPNAGEIRIDGIDLPLNTKLVQQDIGYLPENLPVYQEMIVADYLDYAAELKGLQGDLKYSEMKRAIRATEIGPKLLSPIATLSRGYKQRVGIAQAILGNPKLLILDEPTNGLDPTQTEHMRQLIRELAKTATVILSTHIMQEVAALCDRVLIVRGGKLVVDARLDELRHSNFVLLSTSLEPDELVETIKTLDGVSDSREINPNGQKPRHYRLQINENADRNAVLSSLAKAIVSKGAELYRLQSEQRDLETLFREVSEAPTNASSTEELSHAA